MKKEEKRVSKKEIKKWQKKQKVAVRASRRDGIEKRKI